ncbi:Imm8 family immunity protein [Nocardioides panacisoli]|uniref:Imm8 family immunity protein n=1 Tax=Nocardioides panacisoli TaxID=627624 RepID=UPI001F47548A|nr:Imm8 family immunity protein [Nocardioides panacisoli]
MTVYASLRSIDLQPEPSSLPADAEEFCFLARLYAGPADGPGEESFDITVCSPEWLAAQCRDGGIFDARHHLVVDVQRFDQGALVAWLEKRVQAVSGDNWSQVGKRLGHLGFWEFEDYRP